MVILYRGLEIRPVDFQSIPKYLELFRKAFPNFSTSSEYLEWLYFKNPNGNAIGFDAFDGSKVVSHYVCIPINIDVFSKPCLLALNTATDPQYQGRGLLKVLANKTYEVFGHDFACVIGVANAKAIKPLTKHLGFEHLGNLELRFGFLNKPTQGRRVYSLKEARWRSTCPGRSLDIVRYKSDLIRFTRKLFGFIPITSVCSIVEDEDSCQSRRFFFPIGLTLDWRRGKRPLIFLPKKLKPSPLSLVFRPLSEDNSNRINFWTFPDFDVI